jgi:hypothetical protein
MRDDTGAEGDLPLRDKDAENVSAGKKSARKRAAAQTGLAAPSQIISYTGPYPTPPPEQPFEFTEQDC